MSVIVAPLTVPKAVVTPSKRSPLGAFFGNYWTRRVIKAVVTIYFVATLTFFLVRLMPGNPVEAFILNLVQTQGIPFQQAQQLAASLFSFNVNEPLWQQYLTYVGNLVHGDLGMSIASTGTPVSRMILQFLPWTLFSVGVALFISFILGIALGMLMAYNRNSLVDNALSVIGAFSPPSPIISSLSSSSSFSVSDSIWCLLPPCVVHCRPASNPASTCALSATPSSTRRYQLLSMF